MNKVKRFKSNTKGRDLVVGDLHGCCEDLLLALKAIKFNMKIDRLFSVGDLIDRGPDSFECAELIYKPWFHAVQGNHEDLMIKSVLHNDEHATDIWLNNGGMWIYDDGTYKMRYTKKQLNKLATDLNELPYVIVVGEGEKRFNIVHAEFIRFERNDNVSDDDIDSWTFHQPEEYSMLWGRALLGEAAYDQGSPHEGLSQTYVGHTPTRQVLRCYQQMYIDTGCVYHYYRGGVYKNDTNMLAIACPSEEIVYRWSPAWKKLSKLSYAEIPSAQNLINKTKGF